MKLLIVRHAIAQNREIFAKTGDDDRRRPLTREGHRKFARGAKGIARLVPRLDGLATSPLARANETAEILAKAYGGGVKPVQLAALAPGRRPHDVLAWVKSHPVKDRGATVAVVGHEPDLSTFASWALTGLQESFVEMKKGSAILVEFEKDVAAGRAKLLWALAPRLLREM
ncbi:MAG: SixA phosphatase family protein [Tepidisphaeraceae bacterium]